MYNDTSPTYGECSLARQIILLSQSPIVRNKAQLLTYCQFVVNLVTLKRALVDRYKNNIHVEQCDQTGQFIGLWAAIHSL